MQALPAAWSAIAGTPVPVDDPARSVYRADHLRLALEAAVRGGRDADTVAAIAGGLLGATNGAVGGAGTGRGEIVVRRVGAAATKSRTLTSI